MMPFHPWVDGDLLTTPAHRAGLPAIPLVVGTTAHEMELFRDQVPVLPDDIAVMYLAGKAANLGITDEDACPCRVRRCGGDLVEAVADLELHVPNEMLAPRARGARQPRVPLPVRLGGAGAARLSRARPAVHVRHPRREHVARRSPGADGSRAAAADALSARMQDAWTSFAATGAPHDSAAGPWPNDQLVHPGNRCGDVPRRRRRAPRRALVGGRVSGARSPGRSRSSPARAGASARACALELGAAGATVYVTARSTSEADHPLPGTIGATAQEIDAGSVGAGIAVALDHRDDDAVEALFDRVLDEHGRLDVLVNNAFIVTDELTSGLPFWEVPISNWDDMIDVGTRSAYVASVFAARRDGAGAGSGLIVNVSSSGAEEYAWQVAYGVGKCALDRITADTAHELDAHGVSVVSVWPGFVRTERIDVGAAAGLLPASLDLEHGRSRPASPVGRWSRSPPIPTVARWSGRRWPPATWPTSTASPTSTAASPPAPSATAPPEHPRTCVPRHICVASCHAATAVGMRDSCAREGRRGRRP